MKAFCIHNTSVELSREQRGRSAESEYDYDLTVGREYVVLAMGIWESVLHVLVRDDWGGPCFCPAALFDMSAQPFPTAWEFELRDGIRLEGRYAWTHWVAVWGYSELVKGKNHTNDLLELKPEALDVFEREYRKALDEM